MRTKYKYFKDYHDAFVHFIKSTAWYYETEHGINYSNDVVINNHPSRMIALYSKKTGEVLANAELHYSLCGKYVVINRYYSFFV